MIRLQQAALSAAVALGACQGSPAPPLDSNRPVTRCGPADTVGIAGGTYVAQNNVWGATTPQCIQVPDRSRAGFAVTSASHNQAANGAPAAFPSLFMGCHWGLCTRNSRLPIRLDSVQSASSTWSTGPVASGAWNVAYDIWTNRQPTTSGAPDGVELMIWINWSGVQPFGTRVATASIDGSAWDVWFGINNGLPLVSYARVTRTDSVSLDLKAFLDDSRGRGNAQGAWYLIAIEAGFEIWQGGTGLTTRWFRADAR